MDFGPVSRILLRYGIGYIAGSGVGEALALDHDMVFTVSLFLGAMVEGVYVLAKRKGWAT
jgi:hypothetical protein